MPLRTSMNAPSAIPGITPTVGHRVSFGHRSLREIELDAIHAALEQHGGNKPQAAEQLGVSLKTMYNKLNQANTMGKTA